MPKKPSKKLTPKQALFCKEYLIDLNATQAAIRAGYSKKTAEQQGPRLLGNVRVQTEIQKGIEKREKRIEISQDYVLTNIKEIGERCMQRVPVMVRDGKEWVQKTETIMDEDGDIQVLGVWEFREMGALKAQELLGRHLKMFTDKHIHEGGGEDGNPIEIVDHTNITTEERSKRLQAKFIKATTR